MLGLRVRPPLYQSFTRLAAAHSVAATVFWGLGMWGALWTAMRPMPALHHLPFERFVIVMTWVSALVFGIIVGRESAAALSFMAEGLRLPDLDGAPPDTA